MPTTENGRFSENLPRTGTIESTIHRLSAIESTPKTPKIKKGSFGDIFIFLNPLKIKHQRISKNKNLIQNSSFYEN